MKELRREILRLKEFRKAVILSHNYQADEIQDIADFTGDSLELARRAASLGDSVETVVFCGVYFMAETAAILNPSKKILIPDPLSGCPLADMITAKELSELKADNPGATAVCYVNSSAEVKAVSDICCTSSNAEKVVGTAAAAGGRVIFVPDRNLGDWVRRRTGADMIIWDGFCPTHDRVAADDIAAARLKHPSAKILAHPECRAEVLELADEVASTSGMLKIARESPDAEFIIVTESGLLWRLRKENPSKKFHSATPKLVCPNMKKNDLHKLHRVLKSMDAAVDVPEDVRVRAKKAIERMLSVK
ncbi:MAG: quinolinate synthase [Elusimicrobia bacterium HGW-Elusimicrobia-1]|nr:MAG: quinolinate synthase [Elusimicrobia bacterium HGW-Elusimicrobia-1]